MGRLGRAVRLVGGLGHLAADLVDGAIELLAGSGDRSDVVQGFARRAGDGDGALFGLADISP